MFNFGQSAAASQPASSGFTFGSTAQSQPQQSTSLFGGFSSTGNPASQAATSSFGGFGAQPAASTGSAFGFGQTTQQQAQTQQPQQQTSLFGGFGQTPATTLNTAGQPTATTTQLPSTDLVKPTTRFNDLPPAYKQEFTQLEAFIRQQNQLRDDLNSHLRATIPSGGPTALPPNLDLVHLQHRLDQLLQQLNQYIKQADQLSTDVNQELHAAEQNARTVQRLTSSANGYSTGDLQLQDTLELPTPYHWWKLQQFMQRYQSIQLTVTDMDEYMQSLQHSHSHDPQLLESTIRNQHLAIIGCTGWIAQLHERAETLRNRARQVYGKQIDALFAANSTQHANVEGNVSDPTSLMASALPTAVSDQIKHLLPAVTQTQMGALTAATTQPATGFASSFTPLSTSNANPLSMPSTAAAATTQQPSAFGGFGTPSAFGAQPAAASTFQTPALTGSANNLWGGGSSLKKKR